MAVNNPLAISDALARLQDELTTKDREIAHWKEAIASTAYTLLRVWRCNTDQERQELGYEVADAIEKYARHPSNMALNQATK